MVVKAIPKYRPYLLGDGGIGRVPLDSHECWNQWLKPVPKRQSLNKPLHLSLAFKAPVCWAATRNRHQHSHCIFEPKKHMRKESAAFVLCETLVALCNVQTCWTKPCFSSQYPSLWFFCPESHNFLLNFSVFPFPSKTSEKVENWTIPRESSPFVGCEINLRFTDPPAIWKGPERLEKKIKEVFASGGNHGKCHLFVIWSPKAFLEFKAAKIPLKLPWREKKTLKHVHSKSEEIHLSSSSHLHKIIQEHAHLPFEKTPSIRHLFFRLGSVAVTSFRNGTWCENVVLANGFFEVSRHILGCLWYLSAPILFVVEPDWDVFVKINLCLKCLLNFISGAPQFD